MGFPEELKKLNQWVCWRRVPDKGGKDKKMPFDPRTGKGASSSNPATWTDYRTAAEAVDRYGYTGVGFVFAAGGGIVGVDIDHCYDPSTGKFSETAEAIIAKQPTYTEFSPSGDGVHLFFKGRKPEGANKNTSTGVEMYDSVRYFTVTENQLAGTPDTVSETAPGTLEWIHQTYIAPRKKEKRKKKSKAVGAPLTDEEVLEKASSAGDGESFTRLWNGQWQDTYPSQSEADMALCMKLAFWTGRNAEQMDRLFRQSALLREKWDERHHADGSTYGEETIAKAIDATDNVYALGGTPVFAYEGRYFRAKADGRTYALTNFMVEPVEMIVSEDETQLTADLVTVSGERYRKTFASSDFTNTQKFKAVLNRNTIALDYYGGDGDLELLKSFISGLPWERKTGVAAMGVYAHNGRMVFVSPEGSIEAGGVAVEDVVQLERSKVIRSGILDCELLDKEDFAKLCRWLMAYNDPAKTMSVLAWVAGCFIKAQLRAKGYKFPHLFLIGEAGSGKSTTMEKVLLPIFSCSRVLAAGQATAFTMMREAASSNTIPLFLDEFKPSKIERNRLAGLYNHFRSAYDGQSGNRGRADQTVTEYPLLAPLVVAGEESADESAARERTIELLFSKKDLRDPERRRAFNRVSASERKLQDFGRTLLNTALTVQPDAVAAWYKEGYPLFTETLPDRVKNNLACCYAGLKLLEKCCADLRVAWDAAFPFAFDICVGHLDYAARTYLFDGTTNNKSIVEQTFEVMSRMGLDPKTEYEIAGGEGDRLLYIRLDQVYDRYTKYRKDYAVAGEVLPMAQFKKQLKASDLYMGNNVQRRIGGGPNTKCWVVDYETLLERCDAGGFDLTEIVPL